MAPRVGFLLLLLLSLAMAAAVTAESFSFDDPKFDIPKLFDVESKLVKDVGNGVCNGQIGDCNEEEEEEMMMPSEEARRVLAQARHISYAALNKNNVPCNRRGNPYYNCARRGRVNPYRRSCSNISRCNRATR